MKELALSFKITVLTAALIAVVYGIYHLKTRGMGPKVQHALGVQPNYGAGIKAKVISSPVLKEATSQTAQEDGKK